jgi:hypothetical protein
MGPIGGITPEDSVRGMRDLIEKFTIEQSGCFFRYDGIELPW